MAVSSTRNISIGFTGDVNAPNLAYNADTNAASPGMVEVIELSTGFNSIPVPNDAVAATIIPPAANDVTLTLKGITGDTGIPLHLTDPTSIGLAEGSTTIGITAGDDVTIRIVWT